jgi:hypothetical protein
MVYTAFMQTLSPDTSPEVERIMIEGCRKMPTRKKLEQVWELTQLVRQLAMNDIRRRYPLADDRERKLRPASRWLEPELMKNAFAWDPEKEGY